MNPLLLTDGYKISHHQMYPLGTSLVYSNFTPRSVGYMPKQAKDVVVFGVQYVLKYIKEVYQKDFFDQPKEVVLKETKEILSAYLGSDYDVTHFENLHDLGYLPIVVKALLEGSIIKEKIPILTIYNTLPEFYWVTNFLETLISSLLWKPLHSASVAYGYKKILLNWANKTDNTNLGFVDYQGHDFSFRGMQHPESAISSALGFLTSFKGSDTIPVLIGAKHYYNEINSCNGVPASEHSVATAYGKEDEIVGFKRLMDLFPTGILSVVSDSFDLWKVCTEYVVTLKEQILAREGKLVLRPDSGDPVDIVCGISIKSFKTIEYAKSVFEDELYSNQIHGEPEFEISTEKLIQVDGELFKLDASVEWNRYDKQYYHIESISTEAIKLEFKPEHKGVVECLWEVFGGTINKQGYKVLDSHIGVIYGDSITLERAEEICKRLEAKGFASTNVVLGVGSYSLGYATRDSQGCAIKSTYVEINGVGRVIFKDPVTDSGTKKSAKGLLQVAKNDKGEFILVDNVTWEQEQDSYLEEVFRDGNLIKETNLTEIRERINSTFK